ncbi:hypothetical protein G6F56_010191 [Rhizopus delemar]|uniref:Vacuolar ATPase assembly protein VMA22 n=1 Tax=Rhizopus stolonifer TaxID=4846 RepID=A0A367KU87_RHIST|nr:hypothetical protein G6F56_010191 [Rhizopus delemar]RCI05717.1 hypothetical protein CU098_012365 [Rhizopus stolonifer]
MTDNYKTICDELDALTLTYLSKVSEYIELCKDNSNHFQKGFVELAHAKYTMGTRTISHYSYDKRMKASLQVETDDLKRVSIKQDKSEKDKPEQMKEKEEGLRKRNTQTSNDSEPKIEPKQEKKVKKTNKDPLHWFGLFVSPSLRTSQKSFKLATEKLIDQVNTIIELKEMEERYHDLLESKEASRQDVEV